MPTEWKMSEKEMGERSRDEGGESENEPNPKQMHISNRLSVLLILCDL